jgi:fluoride ion exporter CrcB/FEX
MFLAVVAFIRNVAPTAPMAVLLPNLIGAVILGALTYVAVVGLTWWMAGKPEGAESQIAGKILPHMGKLRARLGV